ncbi:hypothetical protein [Xylanimonas protaetiae]|uniref:Uncharacterized protein n=1 Tax=Xylanimonas protaetiae TaxID=2509457 RepID=A0A4P6EZV7_9MICO|nr:hypothetical protein [Xylanimonas protaetiae]QAY68712.1 hypothetical protein ET471_00520 [Xylanimonas protaetiae]
MSVVERDPDDGRRPGAELDAGGEARAPRREGERRGDVARLEQREGRPQRAEAGRVPVGVRDDGRLVGHRRGRAVAAEHEVPRVHPPGRPVGRAQAQVGAHEAAAREVADEVTGGGRAPARPPPTDPDGLEGGREDAVAERVPGVEPLPRPGGAERVEGPRGGRPTRRRHPAGGL